MDTKEFARDVLTINCTQKSTIWMDIRACLITASSLSGNFDSKFKWFIDQSNMKTTDEDFEPKSNNNPSRAKQNDPNSK